MIDRKNVAVIPRSPDDKCSVYYQVKDGEKSSARHQVGKKRGDM